MEPEVVAQKKFPWLQLIVLAILGVAAGASGYVYLETRGLVTRADTEPFVVPMDMKSSEAIDKLIAGGYVRNPLIFKTILRSKNPLRRVTPGGYELSKAMSAFTLASVISSSPHSVWVTIPEGLRKEEVVQILTEKLHWPAAESPAFTGVHKELGNDYFEGVYFPDTYLIPTTDGGDKVAKHMIRIFNEKLATLSPQLLQKNIRWTTALKVASLIQREAASKSDMPLIAAILWNRLEKKQRLEVDATIQYAKGSIDGSWWAPLKSGDTNFTSPYNTYRNSGLPPTPIANPGLDALKAAANPSNSTCLYYIHDSEKQIHCATTFEAHKANIAKYLK